MNFLIGPLFQAEKRNGHKEDISGRKPENIPKRTQRANHGMKEPKSATRLLSLKFRPHPSDIRVSGRIYDDDFGV